MPREFLENMMKEQRDMEERRRKGQREMEGVLPCMTSNEIFHFKLAEAFSK